MKRSSKHNRQHPSSRRSQSGVALIVALILLVVMTLLGLGAMRSATLEEKMATNTFDRSLSFQAAESTLRQAEALLNLVPPASPPTPVAGTCLGNGFCGAPLAGASPRWTDTAFPASNWANAATVNSGSIAITPQYLIEHLGSNFRCTDIPPISFTCKRYRVTVRSNAGADRASVMLQTIYATP
jgi:type IV pilus assembly protein PilX